MSTNNTDYYALLEIGKGASEEEIKKAYKKCALKWHPDRNPNNVDEATDKFKYISEAYEVLSNPEKRKIYDQYGVKGLKENNVGHPGGFSDMDAQSIFEQIFRSGGMGNMGGMGGGMGGFHFFQHPQQQPQQPKKGNNVSFDLQLTLRELYLGCVKKLRVNRDTICHRCQGTSIKASSSITNIKCPECKGQGSKMVMQQLGPGFKSQQQVMCNKCKGSGEFIPEIDRCDECKGAKILRAETILDAEIQKGMKDGTKITFAGKSDEYPGRIPGDIIVVVKEKNPFEGFKRSPDGDHLVYKKTITLQEALCGYEFILDHLDGRQLYINSITDIITPQAMRKIVGEGMPIRKNGNDTGTKGDLFIEFDIVFPDNQHLTNKDKQKLKQVLPGPQKLPETTTKKCIPHTPIG